MQRDIALILTSLLAAGVYGSTSCSAQIVDSHGTGGMTHSCSACSAFCGCAASCTTAGCDDATCGFSCGPTSTFVDPGTTNTGTETGTVGTAGTGTVPPHP